MPMITRSRIIVAADVLGLTTLLGTTAAAAPAVIGAAGQPGMQQDIHLGMQQDGQPGMRQDGQLAGDD